MTSSEPQTDTQQWAEKQADSWWNAILGEGFALIDEKLRSFQPSGTGGLRVTGQWPSFIITGKSPRIERRRRVDYEKAALQPEWKGGPGGQRIGFTFVPGVVNAAGYEIIPTVNGTSVFSSSRPYVPIYNNGGVLVLERTFYTSITASGLDDGGFPYNSLSVRWLDDIISIKSYPLSNLATLNTPVQIVADYAIVSGDNVFSPVGVSVDEGILHKLLGLYNSDMDFLAVRSGDYTNSVRDPNPTNPNLTAGRFNTNFGKAADSEVEDYDLPWWITYVP